MKKAIAAILSAVLLLTVFGSALPALAFEAVIYGDANGDGKLDTGDALLALRIANGQQEPTAQQIESLDQNKNGIVDLVDVCLTLRYAIGALKNEKQGSGAFGCFKDDTGLYNRPEDAVTTFNYCLNRIKSEKAGFTKHVATELTAFECGQITFTSYSFSDPETFRGLLKDKLEESDKTEEDVIQIMGEDSTYTMPVTGQDYVSMLTLDDVRGIRVSQDTEKGLLTISVALYDVTMESALDETLVGHSAAYRKVLDVNDMMQNTDDVLGSVFRVMSTSTTKPNKTFVNTVLTVTVDRVTGEVESYVIEYGARVNIASSTVGLGSTGFLSRVATIEDVNYVRTTKTVYNNFQWPVAQNVEP